MRSNSFEEFYFKYILQILGVFSRANVSQERGIQLQIIYLKK